jgi:hypothetical protein
MRRAEGDPGNTDAGTTPCVHHLKIKNLHKLKKLYHRNTQWMFLCTFYKKISDNPQVQGINVAVLNVEVMDIELQEQESKSI